jgi:glycosyltransferase involved in cell wall biosynthesis
MLSICIPTYRYDVRPLVTELLRQVAAVQEGPVEILVFDDASPDDGDWGRAELRQTSGIRYVELPTNLGRAAIRNKMAREATQEFLVMMDADGWPNPNFVRRYLNEVKETRVNLGGSAISVIVTGGRTYAETPPEDPNLHLHWWYGTRRESRTVEQREVQEWLGFQSNNFMVNRSLLLEYPFSEKVNGYGHEDTAWGQQFASKQVFLYHEDNPVVHLGLEANDVFLRKQKQAIENLRLLKNQASHLRTRLIDLVEILPFLPSLARLFPEQALIKHLIKREKPSLYALDLLKLRWWKEL